MSKISIIGGSNINIHNGTTTGTYTVQYNDGVVSPEQAGVAWSITGNATISQDGVVTLKNANVGDKLTITATSTYDTSISASLTVSVTNVATSMSGSYNINNGTSTCTVTVKGYNKVIVYLRSYAEASFDYAEVGPLDGTVTRASTSNVLSTSGKQSATQYYSHTFEISDTNAHTFQVLYSKDSIVNNNDDRGYFYLVCE